MGREIRRVPPDWQHPRDEKGNYRPLFDRDYDVAAEKWLENNAGWEAGADAGRKTFEQEKGRRCYFWEWDGGPPDREYHRPSWPEGIATHYQMYENVTEGTPVSPVFETLDELIEWLVGQGHSRHAAQEFVKTGYAPSMLVVQGGPDAGIYMNIDQYDVPKVNSSREKEGG